MSAALLELVAASVPLKRRGNAWWSACPFHASDKTASFKVEERRGKWRFHCFGCGAGGDAADWLMRTRRVDYVEAKRLLGEPARPDPELIRQREQRRRREAALNAYRDSHPYCELSEPYNAWLVAC